MIVIVDYQMGNLRSVQKALERVGHQATISSDPAVIEQLLYEGKENSHVWTTLTHLSEELGPRLTGSTRLARANEWTRAEFQAWADGVAGRFGYAVQLAPIGPVDDQLGAPTQMAVFTR